MSCVKVSICVAYYNRSNFVLECIQSLLDQDYSSFEVVVVNDGSTDPSTAKILDSLIDPRLKIIHQPNTGFVGAITTAIAESGGQYIAIMGAGDICHPSRIRKQVSILDNKADVGIVSCHFENVVVGGSKDGERAKRDYPDTEITAENFLQGANPIGHGEVMFRRTIYDMVGGYRPFFKFSQDLDLWLRMIDHCNVVIVREYLYERRMFAVDGVSTDVKKQFLQKYLAEFSRQCYTDKRQFGFDYVERYGFHAGLFKKPSKALGLFATSRAIEALKVKKYEDASYFINLASSEIESVKYKIVKLMIWVSQNNAGRVFVATLFKTKAMFKSKF